MFVLAGDQSSQATDRPYFRNKNTPPSEQQIRVFSDQPSRTNSKKPETQALHYLFKNPCQKQVSAISFQVSAF